MHGVVSFVIFWLLKQNLSLPAEISHQDKYTDIYDRRINQLKISNNSDKDGLRANVQSKRISGDLQWISQNNGTYWSSSGVSEKPLVKQILSIVDGGSGISLKQNEIWVP